MRTDAIFRKDFTFDRHKLISEELEGTLLRRWELAEIDIPALAVPGGGGTVNLICDNRLEVGDRVHNLKDAAGNNVFEIGESSMSMYVVKVTPGFNSFGIIIGWTHQLGRELPRSFAEMVSEFGAGGFPE